MNLSFGTICWLRVTDYQRGWMRSALGSGLTVKGRMVLSMFHLPGAHEAFMMGADDDLPEGGVPGNAISDTWYNALEAGLNMYAPAVEDTFGVTKEQLGEYVPIGCPHYAISLEGVIHHWTGDTCFGRQQAQELIKVLRNGFWNAVSEYSEQYKELRHGEHYAQVEMIEAFCGENDTDDVYVEAIRREWQRRLRRERTRCQETADS